MVLKTISPGCGVWAYAIFIILSYLKGASPPPPPSKLTFLTLISILFTSYKVLLCAHYVSLKPLYLLTPFHFFTIFTLCTSVYFSMFDQFEHHVALHFHPLHQWSHACLTIIMRFSIEYRMLFMYNLLSNTYKLINFNQLHVSLISKCSDLTQTKQLLISLTKPKKCIGMHSFCCSS